MGNGWMDGWGSASCLKTPHTEAHCAEKNHCLVENSSHCCEGTSVSNPMQCLETVQFMKCLAWIALIVYNCTSNTNSWHQDSWQLLHWTLYRVALHLYLTPTVTSFSQHRCKTLRDKCLHRSNRSSMSKPPFLMKLDDLYVHDLLGVTCIIAMVPNGAIVQ